MHPVSNLLIGLALIVIPALLFYWKLSRAIKKERGLTKSPFSNKLLRPPGESLRIKINELEDQLSEQLLVIALSLVAPGLFYMMIAKLNGLVVGVFLVLAIAICWGIVWFKWRKIFKLRKQLLNYKLGFDGERCVGAELNPLLSQGYHVYHDFLFDMHPGGDATTFNIDHIAIGPEGIFIIETKAKRKSLNAPVNELEPHQIAVEGTSRENTTLRFPDGSIDEKPVRQALRQAQQFHRWLNMPSISEQEVRPIVVFPGWMIKSEKWKKLGIQSASKIAQRIPKLGKGRRLLPQEIEAIAARIEDKCRNIEGAR
jgi:hypothetical protein